MGKSDHDEITGKFKFVGSRLYFMPDKDENLCFIPWNGTNLVFYEGSSVRPKQPFVVIGGRLLCTRKKQDNGWYELDGIVDSRVVNTLDSVASHSYSLVEVNSFPDAVKDMTREIEVPIEAELLEYAAHTLRCLVMYIEQVPNDSPVLWIGDRHTQVIDLPDFKRAKNTIERLDSLLADIKAKL